jgi:hypothetical protein
VNNETKSAKKKSAAANAADWCVLIITPVNIFVIADYKPIAVELLKSVVPGGARRFFRTAGVEFFRQFPLNEAQVSWLREARYFNGVWEVMPDYRRSLLNMLTLEYGEVWLVEEGIARSYQLPADVPASDSETYALGANVIMPLSWAKSYALYCHKHRAWETEQPCKDAGVIVTLPSDPPKKWADHELHAPQNTLVRATRQQISYYLTAPAEPVRLGRDAEGEKAVQRVMNAQRLALLLRAAKVMSKPLYEPD